MCSSGTEAGQCVRIVVVQGERAIFRAVKHSYFIAVSNSASWIPQRTLTWSPFSMKYLEVEKVRWLAEVGWESKCRITKKPEVKNILCVGKCQNRTCHLKQKWFVRKNVNSFFWSFYCDGLFFLSVQNSGLAWTSYMQYICILPQVSWLSHVTNT